MGRREHAIIPSKNIIDIIEEIDRLRTFIAEKDREIERLKSDCMTLTLRLYGEPLGSMSPETIEVMGRWKPLAAELIGDCPHDPRELKGEPIGQYHCPVCGEVVIAGLPHEPKKEEDSDGLIPALKEEKNN
jgi:hypothetical protein